MCVADVSYIPKETMHYRVYSGNAASTTSSLANDQAIFVGLVELFHSKEVDQVLTLVTSDEHWRKLIKSINQAIDIRIQSKDIQNLARNMISETLVRRFGYTNKYLAGFLISSLTKLGLERESTVAQNLHLHSGYSRVDFLESTANEKYLIGQHSVGKAPVAGKLMNLFSLSARETFFDFVFNSKLLSGAQRPFVRVWRLRGK
jgi:hypothetical protein